MLSFERFQFNISLLDLEFGEDKTFHLDRVFKIDYNILDLTGERAYLVSMTISACFNDPSPCDFTTVILDRAVLPKPPCAWYTGFKDKSFSLAGWKSDNSYPANQVLPTAAISKLMDEMGILDFVDTPACDRQSESSIYANAFQGWVSACSALTPPALDGSQITCVMAQSCLSLDCCVEVNELQRTMRTFVDVDLCNYQLRVGIDRLQFNRTLKGFNWGELDKFDLYGVFVVEYMMSDLHADSELLLNMNISVCYESSAPCDKVFQVFKNTKVPKTTCDWKIDFIHPDFSLSTWMTGKGLNPSDPLQSSYVSELLHDMGVADLINDNSCNRNGARFTGKDSNNWLDVSTLYIFMLHQECSKPTSNLNSLGATTSCRITSECTEVECCMDVNKVGRSFNMYVYADVCNYKLTVGIEKLQLNYSLVDYSYGQSKHVSLYGVINLDFMLTDLSAENLLVFDMNMSVCFEAQGACEIFTGIFSQAKLNKPTCDWNTDFAIKDFSLKKWLSDKGLSENDNLPSHTVQELLHDLDLAYFMKDSVCQRQGVLFTPSLNGWNSGCPQSVSLPTIPGNDTCHLYDYCTGVRCCVEVEKLQRTIDFSLSLDPCNYRLTINIEKLSVEESLISYTFGQKKYFNIQGVLRLEYEITDLSSERKYQVDLKLKVCFESGGPCVAEIAILSGTLLPKKVCKWDTDFLDSTFSIVTWRQQEGIPANDVLTPVQITKLMNDLGLDDFIDNPKCDSTSAKYTPSVNGWKNECTKTLDSPFPAVSTPTTSCVYDSTCTTTECCMGVSSIGTVFSTYVRVDPCTFTMQVGSENLKFSKDIFDYDYGTEEQFWLFGVSRIKFSMYDLATEGYYLTTMELKACLVADTTTTPCDVIIPLLTNYKLPKRSCDWNTQIMDGSAFNLTSWLISESLPDTDPLQEFVVTRLMTELGLTKYLGDSQCDVSSATYTPSVNGWKNECPSPSTLPTISGNSKCQVTSECTKINCCLDVPLLGRTFSFYLHIDACYNTLSVGIEKQYRKHSLIGYSFGTVERFNLKGTVRLEYSIRDLPGANKYVISMKASGCVDSTESCATEVQILDNTFISKPACTWDANYPVQEFSRDQWIVEQNLASSPVFPSWAVDAFLAKLQLAQYVKNPTCSRSASMYTPASNGWKNDCGSVSTLPSLSAHPMNCNLGTDCDVVTCCIEAAFLTQSFETSIKIDNCDQTIELSIEKLSFKISLANYVWARKFFLNSAVRIGYTLYDLVGEEEYLANVDISLCWESFKPCQFVATVLQNTRLPKKTCQYNTNFIDAVFDLTTWGTANSIDTSTMTSVDNGRLFEYLDIGHHMKAYDQVCDQFSSTYSPSLNGWKTDSTCTDVKPATSLPNEAHCAVGTDCRSIDCCIKTPTLNDRPINIKFGLDNCNWKMTIGIEMYSIEETLYGFTFDQWDTFYLKGAFKIDYKIIDLQGEDEFLVWLKYKSCFSATAPCSQDITVLDATRLPKQTCTWNADFSVPNFSLSGWKTSNGVGQNDVVDEYIRSRILTDIGISQYLNDVPCSSSSPPYTGATNGWKNDCPTSLPESLSSLNSGIVGNIKSKCTEVSFCYQSDNVNRNFEFTVDIDSCSSLLTVSVEKYSHQVSLFDFTYGKTEMFSLGGAVNVMYNIVDMPNEGSFRITLWATLCWESSGSCEKNETVFSQQRLPKLPCDFKQDYKTQGFSLSTWFTNKGYTPVQSLTGTQRSELLQDLGMARYLLTTPCNQSSAVYEPSNQLTTWKNECAGLSGLPVLPSEVRCNMASSCTSVDCCVAVDTIDTTMNTFVSFDPCTFVLTVGIDNYKFRETLLNYRMGNNYILFKGNNINTFFDIDDLWAKHQLIMNMKISVCFEASGPCVINNVVILDNEILPKQSCQLSPNIPVQGFSLKAWRTAAGYGDGDVLSVTDLAKVHEMLGMSAYLDDTVCDRTSAPYGPTSNGWMKDCAERVTLPFNAALRSNCILTSSCTGISCCTSLENPLTSFRSYLTIDSCGERLTVGIDHLSYNISLLDFNFGTEQNLWLQGVYRLDYIIWDLSEENVYIVTMNISACFESSGDCLVQETIISQVNLPKPSCNYKSADYKIPGFSLSGYLASLGKPTIAPLDDHIRAQLLRDTGLAPFMSKNKCDRSTGVYAGADQKGWTSACSMPVDTYFVVFLACSMPVDTKALPDNITCHIPSSCTAVQCCIDVDIISSTVSTLLSLDPCQQKLTIKIEELTKEDKLYDFTWGTPDYFYLENIFRIEYVVNEFSGERKYLINLNISVCWESGQSCDLVAMVFDGGLLPMKPCVWNPGFVDPSFSLTKWYVDNSLSAGSSLSKENKLILQDTLGISEYLLGCNRNDNPYTPAINGWKTECTDGQSSTGSFSSSQAIGCYVDSTCTNTRCCVEIDTLGRSVETKLLIDPCNFKLQISIDRLSFEVSLYEFQYGMLFILDLDNLYAEGKYLISMSISECWESAGPCDHTYVVYDNVLMTKPMCNWTTGYLIPDFSLTTYLTSKGVSNVNAHPYPKDVLLHLTEDTGLARYTLDSECDNTAGVYAGAIDGFTSSCTAGLTLPILPLSSDIVCHITDFCTGVECCYFLKPFQRSVDIKFSIDHCNSLLFIKVENAFYNRSLVDFDWGTEQNFELLGIIRIKYKIYNLQAERSYHIDMEIASCYESSGQQCATSDTYQVFNDTVLPKQICDWSHDYIYSDFNFAKWKGDKGVSGDLDDYHVSTLLDTLGVAAYMETSQCSRTSNYYVPSTDGWFIACQRSVDLPTLNSDTMSNCRLTTDCTGVECCTDVPQIQRTLRTFLKIDSCTNRVNLGIERFHRNISLTDYTKWGQQEQFWLGGVFRVDFTIHEMYGQKYYRVDMTTSVCFNASQSCDIVVPIFQNTLLPKSICSYDTDFYIPNFSLDSWLLNEGLPLTPVSGSSQKLLMSQLGVAPYLEDTECSFTSPQYNNNPNGWVKDCALSVNDAALQMADTTAIRANLGPSCTSVNMCIKGDKFGRNFHGYVEVDPCSYQLRVGIEEFFYNRTLEGYSWDFQLSSWLTSRGLSLPIDQSNTVELMRDLHVGRYMQSTQCSQTDQGSIYQGSTDGFTSSCTSLPVLDLPNTLSGSKTVCHIDNTCTKVSCCSEVSNINRNMEISIDINNCEQNMKITLERYTFNVDLRKYTWKQVLLIVMFILFFSYNIQELVVDNSYFVDLSVSVCLNAQGPCDFTNTVFTDMTLPRRTCTSSGFSEIDSSFKLKNWLADRNEDPEASVISDLLQAELFQQFKIAPFMRETASQCDLANAIYQNPDANSFTTACATPQSNPQTLPSGTVCHIPVSCTAVMCCTNVALYNRKIYAALDFNECGNIITVTVEDRVAEYRYPVFDFGKFKISNQENNPDYLVDFKVSVCTNSTGPCDMEIVVLSNANYPRKTCDYVTGFIDTSFSYDQWLLDKGIQNYPPDNAYADKLMVDLGLQHVISRPESCSHTDSIYSRAAVNNWINDCARIDNSTLGAITTNNTRCYIPTSCHYVSCCMIVPELRRHLLASVFMETCTFNMTAKLEDRAEFRDLFPYTWQTQEEMQLYGVLRMKYLATSTPNNEEILMHIDLKTYFEGNVSSYANYTDSEVFSLPLKYQTCDPAEEIPFKANCPGMTIPAEAQTFCKFTSDCKGVECCLPTDYIEGTRKTSFIFQVLNCNDKLDFSLERKSTSLALSGITRDTLQQKEYGTGPLKTFTVNYTLTEMAQGQTVDMSIDVCGLVGGTCKAYDIMSSTAITATNCGGGKRRRRKKRQADPEELDPTDFPGGMRSLMESGASEAQIKRYVDRTRNYVFEEQYANLEEGEVPEFDDTVTVKTSLKSLGRKNPFTIPAQRKRITFVRNIDGEEQIIALLEGSNEPEREDMLFVVGLGLSQAGVEMLGEELADMTIVDIENLMDQKFVDPSEVFKLSKDLRDLARGLYSDFIEKIFDDPEDIFKSFDLSVKGDFSFPRVEIILFSYSQFFMVGGLVPMTFEFGAGGYYGMDFLVNAKILEMKAIVEVTPYGGLLVYGELGIGLLLYGKLRLEGEIMDLRFPTTAEITFNKFPLDVQLTMYLELTPIKLNLFALVTLEIELLGITKTLFEVSLFEYTTPTIRKKLIDNSKKEEDKSPPVIEPFVDNKSTRKRRDSDVPCEVKQLINKDYTEPEFKISIRAADDRSQVKLTLNIGTSPGASNVLQGKELGGPSTILKEKLSITGVPLYFTVRAENDAGGVATATCSLPTYDVTLPVGRITPGFTATSNAKVMKAQVVAFEDSEMTQTQGAIGYGIGIYGEQIVGWKNIVLKENNVNTDIGDDPLNQKVLTLFTELRTGRLVGRKLVFATYKKVNSPGLCAKYCSDLPPTKCSSFNYDFGTSGTCELCEGIESPSFELHKDGLFEHYERLGVGKSFEFDLSDLKLLHNQSVIVNVLIRNKLGYQSIISSSSVSVDFTCPEPGPISNATADILEIVPCKDNIPNDRLDWELRCRGINAAIKNHREIQDGPGSRTVFNGHNPLNELLYTKANTFISANWDGFYDYDSKILGYSLTAGLQPCADDVHNHHDPHKHFFEESQWTYNAMVSPIDAPYTILPDGRYYVSVRAINKVDYGGPLSTTVCHTTPFAVDNSPPVVYDVYDIKYDEDTFNLTAYQNSSDPHSGLVYIDVCLGETTRDCYALNWRRFNTEPFIQLVFPIQDGVAVWFKIKAINNVDLRTIKVADAAIIVDRSPPIAGVVNDGPTLGVDIVYTNKNKEICANWQNFYDPESGISLYMMSAGSEPLTNSTDVSSLVRLGSTIHTYCIPLNDTTALQHNNVYYATIWAFNQAVVQRNISAISNGVLVDLTAPVEGQLVDGDYDSFADLEYSANKVTVALQWKNFADPESGILEYKVRVNRAADLSGNYSVIRDWVTLTKTATEVKWLNFDLSHRDQVKSELMTINGATTALTVYTSGFILDLTRPDLKYLRDGLTSTDREFQSNTDSLSVSFKYVDEESDIDHYKVQIFRILEGTKQQIVPNIKNAWKKLTGPTDRTTYTETGLTLENGLTYLVKVGAVNKAGYQAAFTTNGVIIDKTKPTLEWIRVGTLSGQIESIIDGYVYQADPNGIEASWSAFDAQSNILDYKLAVGTTPGGTDIMDWKSVGAVTSLYIDGLSLSVTDDNTKIPVYYVSMKAENGAGLISDPITSTPIVVVQRDKPGITHDGADKTEGELIPNLGVDIDYQPGLSTVTVQFNGFASFLHGVMRFEMAVGTTPGGEDLLGFTERGIMLKEESNVPGGGVASTGCSQVTLPLKPATQYYTTIRGITNSGNVLESVSDGFMVDITGPAITMESDNQASSTDISMEAVIYQQTAESLEGKWSYNDTESLITDAWYSVGTYPYADDVKAMEKIDISVDYRSSIPYASIQPSLSGKPNMISVWSMNSVGITTKITSASLVVDSTPPVAGNVTCPTYVQSSGPVVCSWDSYIDYESFIVSYDISMGTQQGGSDVFSNGTTAGNIFTYAIQDFENELVNGRKYYVTVTAVNAVGLKAYAFSGEIIVDSTPPTFGKVIDLSTSYRADYTSNDQTVNLNRKICTTDEDCDQLDAICTESLTTLIVTWQPFQDTESGIDRYEVAVGTTSGGGQVKKYSAVPSGVRYHAIEGLNLLNYRQLFVSIKGVNGAGLTSVSTSNGIYMSYLSQGLDPIYPVYVNDLVPGSDLDIDFQVSFDTITASWDTSGDPCPVTNYQWSITRLDGNVTQEYLDMRTKTSGENDELQMANGETYYSLVKVTNALGYQYIIRSDGVTIKDTALLPGKVYDGDVAGFDLDYLPTKTSASGNWNGFGLPPEAIIQVDVETGNPGIQINQSYIDQQDDSQVISFYEVALGSDRRFDETRTNVMPFINVGLNTSVVFYDLVGVTLKTALYYFTVRATSKSFSTAEVSSNGFYMGFDKGVGANEIKVGPCISSKSDMDVIWEDFTTDLTMLLYYVAVSNNNDANGTDCKLYIDGGRASDADKARLFTEMDMTNNGLDTYMEIRNLQLEQNKEYYVYVIGTDKTGQCAMNVTKVLVDVTSPVTGRIKAGPYYDMILTYAVDNASLVIDWENFADLESGISKLELSLWSNTSCTEDSTEEIVVDWISVSSNITTFTMVDLNMTNDKPYTVRLRVTNCAGLESEVATNPIVFDSSTPTAGRVADGLDFTNDRVWFNDRTSVSGSLLHLPSPTVEACPPRPTSMTNATGWNIMDSFGFNDPDGQFWKIVHNPNNVRMVYENEQVEIKMYHDINSDRILSGAYYRSADMDSTGGVYQVQIKCANGSGNAVTGVMFWDGPESSISPYKYQRDIEFPNCQCCLKLPIVDECEGCNCTAYRIDYNVSTDTLTTEAAPTPAPVTPAPPPYDVIDDKGQSVTKGKNYVARASCGIQMIVATAEYNVSRLIAWCRNFNDTYEILKTEAQLPFDPTATFHTYKLVFFSELEDPTAPTRCFQVFIDGEYITEVCGAPELSKNTKLFFHVYNKDNYMPVSDDPLNVWTTRATFANLVLPPTLGLPCRLGDPFRGGTNGIIQYDVGIGRSKLTTEIVSFRKVLEPCLPCFYSCSRINCDPSCKTDVTEMKTFTLTGIDLPPKESYSNGTHTYDVIISYYLTVRATLGSGATVTASSDGFYIDDTPPVFDLDIMKGDFYIDVNQGPLTPVRFSSSNSTIKAFWRCSDKESEIIEYLWAIGTTPGGEEMQNYTSTGTTASGTNPSFEGQLTHESKFYVSVICKNGANKESKFEDQIGLTILLENPNVTDVNTTVEGSADFPQPVTPADAKIGTDPTSIGFVFEIIPDPRIDRYDMCLGSEEGQDDIFPCTWVGYNTSGEVKIMNGSLYLNGKIMSRLSEVKAFNQNQTDDERAAPTNNVFRMEPGRTVFVTCRVCSVAMLCTKKNLGSLTMASQTATFKRSQGGQAIDATVEMETRSSRRRRSSPPTIELVTPSGLAEGQALMIEPLTEDEMNTVYGSASSTNFQPYIVNPTNTTDLTERLLYKRMKDYSYSFTVVPVGHLPMPGPVSISYSDPIGPIQKGLRNMLLHLNPSQQYWEITSRSCTSVDAAQREVWVNGTDTMTVKVCNTWRNPNNGQSSRRRREVSNGDYYHSETQFIVATVDAEVYNSPPELNVSAYVTIQEDQGTLTYQLSAVDEEGDQVYFRLNSNSDTGLGTAKCYGNRTSDQYLLNPVLLCSLHRFTFTPCSGCSGNVSVNLQLYEQQTDPDIPPASSVATIYVNITEVNDPPVAFLAKDGVYMLENDVTEPVAVSDLKQST
ncbi:hypothetical protein FSP39_007535 [Pinctada imbricata]|uniref:Fibronectin type-III domain-containing protein n=1 Tax=Pinctada imbricata TaxID=66713 RepID=A0AA89CA48_PINIB|nr:hypothetical protein FSP39_007535 [Pinctada imbricata]